MPVKVQKKSGQQEDFDRNKVLNGVVKSGAAPEEAENVAKQVEAWVATAAVNGVIQSGDIRSKVLEVLKTVNPTAAAAFETYKKSEATVPPEAPAGAPPVEAPPTEMPPVAPPIL